MESCMTFRKKAPDINIIKEERLVNKLNKFTIVSSWKTNNSSLLIQLIAKRLRWAHLVQCLDVLHVSLCTLFWGLGEVSLELGVACLRFRLDGGDKRGLPELILLLGSF